MNYIFQPQETEKHKVFTSFHNKDESYKIKFEEDYKEHFIGKSVQNGDIDPNNETEYTKRLIREDFISDSSIIVALYGNETKERKHVDWEISAGLSGNAGGCSGLIVILLPSFPVVPFDTNGNYKEELIYPHVHPRTAKNIKSGFAKVYFWPTMYQHLPTVHISDILQESFDKRITHKHLIDNTDIQYKSNR